MTAELHPDAINAILNGDHGAPFDVLGPHTADDHNVVIRVLRPTAKQIDVIDEPTGTSTAMTRLRDEGFFEATISSQLPDLRYHYEARTHDNRQETFADAYAFPSLLSDFDLYIFGEGSDLNSYDKLGAHLCEIDGVKGVSFAVWAPNAYKVSVIGTFNDWDKRVHPMRLNGSSGVWDLFIPEATEGDLYRYEIRSRIAAFPAEKVDPYGFKFERRPNKSCFLSDLDGYIWQDTKWIFQQAPFKPLTR